MTTPDSKPPAPKPIPVAATTTTMTTEAPTASSPPAGAKKRKRPAQSPGAKNRKKPTTSSSPSKAKATKAKAKKPTTSAAATPITLPPTRTLIVDNGGDTLKYGWMTDAEPRTPLMNVSARLIHQFTTLVADELRTVQNPNSLIAPTRSTERGMITNLENQTRVWKRMLDLLGVVVPVNTEAAKSFGWNIAARKKANKASINLVATPPPPPPTTKISAHTIAVILLLPPHCPRGLLDQLLQVWFEDFGVAHVGLGISSVCASHDQILATPWKTSCTVDLGWSSSLVVPTFKNQVVSPKAIRRLPVGGRHMINMLKYYMSYRQYNLMEQTQLLREVFEKLSFLSMDMKGDMALAREKPSGRRIYDRDFVLPDYKTTQKGEIRIPPLLQRDLEREAAKKKQGNDANDEDDDDEEEDEDFVIDADEEDDSDEDVVMSDADDDGKRDEPAKKGKKLNSTKKRKKGDDEEEDEADDDEEETMEQKRKRILHQRALEERRRREQEEEEQILRVSVERFTVPEVLLKPLDAGVQPDLMGLAHAIVQSVESCPLPYRPALYRTIYLVGGVSRLPNLKPRLEQELRCLIPSEFKMSLAIADSPIDRAWLGAKALFEKDSYLKWS
ncbi:MAG: hypothetical protein SGILL_004571, partial [Bacillariaceae sp.]